MEEQAHGENASEAVESRLDQGHVEFGVGVVEIDVESPRKGEDQHYHNQQNVADGADCVDLPEGGGGDEREGQEEEDGVHKKEHFFSQHYANYGIVRLFRVKKIRMSGASHICDGLPCDVAIYAICNNEKAI